MTTTPIPATADEPTGSAAPVLRSLAPRLRGLERSVRSWLDQKHAFPIALTTRTQLEALVGDLARQAEALDVEKPLLVVMLMGGTGVGKSTLMNALAGATIGQASFTRPTTRDPVVYHHVAVRAERLDPSLRYCRLVQHDRPELAQKIIVDTPDLDSNDRSNRDKLLALLPVADIVLYVGSQEKYHDQIGWELFKAQRKRKAFGFVLNKWDRCRHDGAAGLRPDEDLLRDLTAEGFEKPRLFRTVAQSWVDHAQSGKPGPPEDLPEGEQFHELRDWLELGLNKMEIEAVKARGVGTLLTQLRETLAAIQPPDLGAIAEKTGRTWERAFREEAEVAAGVLLGALDPFQTEIEHHFSLEAQRRYRGLMAAWLKLTDRIRFMKSTLPTRLPLLPRLSSAAADAAVSSSTWNLQAFTREVAQHAGEQILDKRTTALVNRLLVEADQVGFPLNLITEPTNEAARGDWRERYNLGMMEALAEAERQFNSPEGFRKALQVGVIGAANIVPELGFLGGLILLLYRFSMVEGYKAEVIDIALPFLITLVLLLLFQFLIALLLPVRWSALRTNFQRLLSSRMLAELTRIYGEVPQRIAAALVVERDQIAGLLREIDGVTTWLEERRQAADIAGLYGN